MPPLMRALSPLYFHAAYQRAMARRLQLRCRMRAYALIALRRHAYAADFYAYVFFFFFFHATPPFAAIDISPPPAVYYAMPCRHVSPRRERRYAGVPCHMSLVC